MDNTMIVNVLDARSYKEGTWIVKISRQEWNEKNIDDQKRVNTKKPEWWFFVATKKPIPTGLMVFKIHENITKTGTISNYLYLGPYEEDYAEGENVAIYNDIHTEDNDNIYVKISLISLQIYQLEQERNFLLKQLQ